MNQQNYHGELLSINCVAFSTCLVSAGQIGGANFMEGYKSWHQLLSQQRLYVHVQNGNCGQHVSGDLRIDSD